MEQEKILEQVNKLKRSREHRKMEREQGKKWKRSIGQKIERSREQRGDCESSKEHGPPLNRGSQFLRLGSLELQHTLVYLVHVTIIHPYKENIKPCVVKSIMHGARMSNIWKLCSIILLIHHLLKVWQNYFVHFCCVWPHAWFRVTLFIN